MEDLKVLIESNILYIVLGVLALYIGVKITKKIVKIISGILFLLYSLLKFGLLTQ